MANERATDLDVKRQIFRECHGAASALADAFAGAERVFPILSPDAARIVEAQLVQLARKTLRIIDALAFGSQLTHERKSHGMGIQSTDGSEHGGGFVGDSEDLTDPMGGSVDGGSDGSGPLSRDTWLDEDRTPEIVMAKLFEPADLVEGAVSTALAQVGQHEDAPNSGLMVDQYLNSVGLPPGNSWCASFVHWCFLMASNAIGMLNPCPKTGGVLRLWELAPDEVKVASPVRGAVVIMDHGHGHGHTGIVESVNGGGLIETVEGNTNKAGSREGDSVARHIWRPEDGARGKLVGYLDFSRVPLVSKKSAAV